MTTAIEILEALGSFIVGVGGRIGQIGRAHV